MKIHYENGWVISVITGNSTYSDKDTAEVAVWFRGEKMLDPIGWVEEDEIRKIKDWVNNLSTVKPHPKKIKRFQEKEEEKC